MANRINESSTIRRQKTNGQSQKTRKARNATAVKDDVAINENNIILDDPNATTMVRTTPTAHRSNQNRSIPPMAWTQPHAPERNSLVPSLLLFGWNNL